MACSSLRARNFSFVLCSRGFAPGFRVMSLRDEDVEVKAFPFVASFVTSFVELTKIGFGYGKGALVVVLLERKRSAMTRLMARALSWLAAASPIRSSAL